VSQKTGKLQYYILFPKYFSKKWGKFATQMGTHHVLTVSCGQVLDTGIPTLFNTWQTLVSPAKPLR
jgi:hypothetical protein